MPDADVVLQNFALGVMERLGLGYEVISAINPSIVMCNMTAFGRQGPLADKPGYDLLRSLGLESCICWGTKTEHQFSRISPGDARGSCVWGSSRSIISLESEQVGSRGIGLLARCILDCARSQLAGGSVSNGEIEPVRQGNVHPVVGGVGVFETGDEFVTVAAVNNGQWERLTEVMGQPELHAMTLDLFLTQAGWPTGMKLTPL